MTHSTIGRRKGTFFTQVQRWVASSKRWIWAMRIIGRLWFCFMRKIRMLRGIIEKEQEYKNRRKKKKELDLTRAWHSVEWEKDKQKKKKNLVRVAFSLLTSFLHHHLFHLQLLLQLHSFIHHARKFCLCSLCLLLSLWRAITQKFPAGGPCRYFSLVIALQGRQRIAVQISVIPCVPGLLLDAWGTRRRISNSEAYPYW